MDFETYKSAFIKEAKAYNRSKKYIQNCLDYARPIIDKGCPIIYDARNFSMLVGYNLEYILRAISFTQSYYWHFSIDKKNGGKREIEEPLPSLKEIQIWMLKEILYKIQAHRFAKAYIPNKHLKENARFHTGKKFVITMDIHDFFTSIKRESITEIFSAIGYSDMVSSLLSKICCLKDCLPQGAPTSPYLSNLFMSDFDEHMKVYCEGKKIMYTRYADDLTFSSNDLDIKDLENEVKKSIEAKGLTLNVQKTHIMRNDQRQMVTGMVVNKRARLPKDERRVLRLTMYYIMTKGLRAQMEVKHIGKANYGKYILGKINYALSLEPSNTEYGNYKIFMMKELFPEYKRTPRKLRLTENKILKEKTVAQVPSNYIAYIKEHIKEGQNIKWVSLLYHPNAYHINSIFEEFFRKNYPDVKYSIVEGVVVTIDGFAYEHIWTKITVGKNVVYYDIIRDCLEKRMIQVIDRSYYPQTEISLDNLLDKISRHESLFSQDTHNTINKYYEKYPTTKEKYNNMKKTLEK